MNMVATTKFNMK